MKKILLTLVVVCFLSSLDKACAQTVTSDLIGLGMRPELADYLSGILPAGAVAGNNTYIKGRNAANSADINMLKIDASDNTVLNSSASDVLILQLEDDANRLINFSAASDTAFTQTFGDAGTTAAQILTFSASTTDADDDGGIIIAGGGATGQTRGAFVEAYGNENAANGNLNLSAGSDANAVLNLIAPGAGISAINLGVGGTQQANFNTTGLTFDAASVGVNLAPYVPTLAATPVAGTNDLQRLSIVPTAAANAAAGLPAVPVAGSCYKIVNTGPNSIRVKAYGTPGINGAAAGTYIPLATMVTADCCASSATAWYCGTSAGVPTPAGP